ncbi:hypothetical protein DDQ68_10120 [Hymenobacter nivis]|uniref:Glycosyltransferase subfamily 4-like N-terminal domain-containing protein n=1 Tax=Hymenobacter nivis TaxID=1850093 RepID=A0A2Z3GGV6_9BACT|nr:hypothetical protein DDQ68_10120 [Hymenobacter nivis]
MLVLAWDDADPAVHRVAATAALPALPTLPLVRALAAAQPTLAVLPQLPEPGAAEATTEAGPAVIDLGAGSHLVGLGDLAPGTLAAGWAAAAARPVPNAPAAGAPAGLANVQLRPPLAQHAAAGWRAPAAPYLGSAETAAAPVVAALTVETSLAETTSVDEAAAAATPGLAPTGPAGAPAPPAAPISVLPGVAPAPLFDQPEAEIGAGEAAALAEDDPDLSVEVLPVAAPTPGPARASLTQGLAALHRAPAAEAAPPTFGLSDGLHYRVIQYARFATYVLDGDGEDFGVIYAPDWPTWLAALEVRARTRRPLVVHLRLLAAESAAPAERGWLLELERMALRFAHTVLVTSDELRAQALRHYPLLIPGQVRTVAADDADGVRAVLAEIDRATRP